VPTSFLLVYPYKTLTKTLAHHRERCYLVFQSICCSRTYRPGLIRLKLVRVIALVRESDLHTRWTRKFRAPGFGERIRSPTAQPPKKGPPAPCMCKTPAGYGRCPDVRQRHCCLARSQQSSAGRWSLGQSPLLLHLDPTNKPNLRNYLFNRISNTCS
jgi:hypothetical protein